VLQRGQVRLYKASPNGRVTTLETLGPGHIFGAISALDQETYPASAEGVTAGMAWWPARSVLLRLLADHPRLGVEVLRIVSAACTRRTSDCAPSRTTPRRRALRARYLLPRATGRRT